MSDRRPMQELADAGQSVWLDYIRRDLMETGELDAMIDAGLRGMTSNPSIFEKAISGGTGSAPMYRALEGKGLIRKDYLNGDSGTGGVYLWESREAAEAWYTDELVASLTERFGVKPRLTWYDTHVTVDNLAGQTRVNGDPISEADAAE